MKALSTISTTTQQSYRQHSHRDFVATSASSRPVSSSSISTTANSLAQRPGAVLYDEDSDYLPSPSVFLPSGRHGTSLRAAWDNAPVTAASRSATLLGDSSSSPPSSPELVSALSSDRKGKGPATRAPSPQKPLPPPFDEDVPLARVRREKRKTWTRAAAAAYESELSSSLGLTTPSFSALALPATTTPDNQKPRRKKRSTAPPALALSSSSSSTTSAPTDLDGSVEILSIVPPAAPVAAGVCDDRASNRNTTAGALAQPDIIADDEWPPSPPRVRRQRQPAVRPYTEQEIIDLTSPNSLGNIPVLSGFDAAIVAQSRALHEANRRHDERLAEMAARAAGFDDWFAEPAISSSASSSSTALWDPAPRTNALLENSTRSSVAAPRSQRSTAAFPTASMQPQRLAGRALRPSNSNQSRSSNLRRLMRNRDDDDVVLVDARAAPTGTNVPLRREPRGTPAERRARRAANVLRNASPPPLSDEEIARQLQEEEYGILQPPNAASIIADLARNYRMNGRHALGSQPWLTDDLSGYPPEILNALVTPNGRGQAEEYMADGELSYERLLAISERIGDARPRGLAPAQVSALPSRKFTAGYNKWSKIKRLKGANDLQRARQTSRITRQLISSVKAGGGETDPAHNLYLASALQLARAHQMPKSTLENALKKAAGSGAAEEDDLLAVVYEGMCPPGVALVVEALTDNKNRTFAEIRHAFKEAGGSMTPVSYLFTKRGRIVFASPLPPSSYASSENQQHRPRTLADMEDDAIEAGVEDIVQVDDEHQHDTGASVDGRNTLEVYCSVKDVLAITKRLKDAGYEMVEFGTVYASEEKVAVPPTDDGEAFGELLDMLENRDDVVKVHHNAN
ncbi:hypothetical protein HDU89_004808 [Geranomyces variabilis]|nr:hypothetical protein HDU89_004808 [Geranomyces variabilis]